MPTAASVGPRPSWRSRRRRRRSSSRALTSCSRERASWALRRTASTACAACSESISSTRRSASESALARPARGEHEPADGLAVRDQRDHERLRRRSPHRPPRRARIRRRPRARPPRSRDAGHARSRRPASAAPRPGSTGGAELAPECLHGDLGLVARAVEQPVDAALQPRAQRGERERADGRRQRRDDRSVSTRQRADPEHDSGVGRRDHGAQQAVGERAVEEDVDVVEAMAHDRERGQDGQAEHDRRARVEERVSVVVRDAGTRPARG